jgi:hypothetical protein
MTKAGAPKIPRAMASSVSARSWSRRRSPPTAASTGAGSWPAARSTSVITAGAEISRPSTQYAR